ncbi:MAG: UDP-N-acetylmuramate dehydrogenase [bacterium]
MSIEQLKIRLGDSLLINEPLASHTNFKIGGPAACFLLAKAEDELINAVKTAKELAYPYFVLGGGSNILVSDQGFPGLVIKVDIQKLEVKDNTIIAGAGIKTIKLVESARDNGLTGLEPLAGIPGTVGGAIYGNAGTYKGIGDLVKEVKVFDGENIKTITKEEADFKYRHSRFKDTKEVILEATLQLERGDIEASKKEIKEIMDKRYATQPYNSPCAGCTFKNVPLERFNKEIIAEYDLEKVLGQMVGKREVPTAYLIDQAGLKGRSIGGAQISDKHTNFIINTGQATAKDVLELTKIIKKEIKDKFKVDLEEEIILVGF